MQSNKKNHTSTALIEAAQQAQSHAYAPYSGFKVGAAVLADHDKVYACCNVENAAYPLGTCAEAGAISAMVADGCQAIRQITIVSPDDTFCFPCGGCRQKIAEFSSDETRVSMVDNQGREKSMGIAELLPEAFNLK